MNFSVDTSDVADAEIEALFLSLNARNPSYAGRWLEGLTRFLDGLSVFPGRYALVENGDPRGREIRKALYRNGQTVYQVLFTLLDADYEDEVKTIRVLHVRHGAQRPMGQPETEGE